MFVYTTCRTCGQELLLGSGVLGGVDRFHATCPPTWTRREKIELEFERNLSMLSASMHATTDKAALKMAERYADECERIEACIREMDAQPPRLGDAALQYAKWGWPVFPLMPAGSIKMVNGKEARGPNGELVRTDKQPATKNGFKDATTDVRRIENYWKANPKANVGIATGHKFDVIDVDLPKEDGAADGRATLEDLLSKIDPATGRGPLPDVHAIVDTASGGMHLYVRPTGSGNRGGWRPGIDIRGLGGYVVAPPSQIYDGRAWSFRWHPSPTLTGTSEPLAEPKAPKAPQAGLWEEVQ